jgi:thiosulfate/3-mercaptopyruvate sulfurtransferase
VVKASFPQPTTHNLQTIAMRTAAALLVTLSLAPPLRAQVRHHPEYLVEAAWLAAHLGSPQVVVLHVGHTDDKYRAGHVPGALFLPLPAVATTVGGVANEFPAPEQLAATFRNLGVGDSARIVIYGDDPGLFAARAWVALDLLGQSARAAILDGGLVRWTAEHRAVETAARTPHPQPFASHWSADRIVAAAWVREHLGDSTVVFVDARPPEAYAGSDSIARSGHLPGARNLYWMNGLVSADDPVLRPMHDLHEELWKPAGADRPAVRTLVTYCRTGMQASHDYFVARYIGYPDVRLYDGSMSEWVGLTPATDYPVERSSR